MMYCCKYIIIGAIRLWCHHEKWRRLEMWRFADKQKVDIDCCSLSRKFWVNMIVQIKYYLSVLSIIKPILYIYFISKEFGSLGSPWSFRESR